MSAVSPPASARVHRAPGRINLIGEHTDYNDGFVLPAAIVYETHATVWPRDDDAVVVRSAHFADQPRTFDLGRLVAGVLHDWSDYVRGMLVELRADGAALQGAELYIESDVPIGAGLSSSASVMIAVGHAMLGRSNITIDGVALARAAQRAENRHVGARTGVMDPFVSANARAGHALLLDTRTLAFEHVPLPTGATVAIVDTLVKHEHATGGYNTRRDECELATTLVAARYPAVRALRDATQAMLDDVRATMPEAVFRRARHIVSENARTLEAAAALRRGELATFGALMSASHASMRDDFELSCVEIDTVVALAASYPGGPAYGARLTGGGFGGSAIVLVDTKRLDALLDHVRVGYRAAFGFEPAIYLGVGAAGASTLP